MAASKKFTALFSIPGWLAFVAELLKFVAEHWPK